MSIEAAEILAGIAPSAMPSGAAGPSDQAPVPSNPRGLVHQAAVDTLSHATARVGLTWLGFLTFLAVFAPLIANTHPILLKSGGHWSSPLLANLTPADALLLIAFATITSLGVSRRYTLLRSIGILTLTLAICAIPCYLALRPPSSPDYTLYRRAAQEGKAQFSLHTPIPYSPTDRQFEIPDARLHPPSLAHWMGTDDRGGDLASEMIHASRIALSIGFLATGVSVLIGVIVGGVIGYYAGFLDLIGMRAIEIIEAVPRLFLLITITAFVQQRNIYLMMFVIGVTGWTGYARYIRGEFFTIRKLDYVQAAIAAGLPRRSIVFRHMLPNALTPVLVNTTFGVASAILYESILSFLGLGLVNQASWGGLLEQARAGGTSFTPWIVTFPGLAIFLTVFSYNMVGEAVRDALDPKLRKRE